MTEADFNVLLGNLHTSVENLFHVKKDDSYETSTRFGRYIADRSRLFLLNEFQFINHLAGKQKVGFMFHMQDIILRAGASRAFYGVNREIFKQLMNSRIEYSVKDVLRHFRLYRKSEDIPTHRDNSSDLEFHHWPVSYTLTQLERALERENPDKAALDALKQMANWEEFSNASCYLVASNFKENYYRLNELVLRWSRDCFKSPPYPLLESDRVGAIIQRDVNPLPPSEREVWHSLFHHAAAFGDKQIEQYIAVANNHIRRIGVETYKTFLQRWIRSAVSCQTEFLTESNARLMKGLIRTLPQEYGTELQELLTKLMEKSETRFDRAL